MPATILDFERGRTPEGKIDAFFIMTNGGNKILKGQEDYISNLSDSDRKTLYTKLSKVEIQQQPQTF